MQGVNAKPAPDAFANLCAETGGNASAIASRLGVARNTVVRWIADDETFAAAIDDARESCLDLTEDRAMMLIQGIPIKGESGEILAWQERPDSGLIKFKLATQGRKRGYGENLDLTSGGKTIGTDLLDLFTLATERIESGQPTL